MSSKVLTDEGLIEAIDKHLTLVSKIKVGFWKPFFGKNRGKYVVKRRYYVDLVGFVLFLRMNDWVNSDHKFSVYPTKI